MTLVSKEHLDDLEVLVDTYGMARIVGALASIAYEKAEHIHSNWQDAPLGKAWDKAASKLLHTADLCAIRDITL